MLDPVPRMLNGSTRWLRRPKALHGWQRFHALPPGADRWKQRIHLLRFRRKAEPMNDRQHEIIRKAQLVPEQKRAALRQLALQHLKTGFYLGHGVRDHLLVGCNSELGKDVALVRDVINQIRV